MSDESSGLKARDLDDVIELATRRAEARQDELSRAELERIAAELDISPAEVEAAVSELKRRRAAEKAAAGARLAGDTLRRKRLTRIGLAVGGVVLLLALWTPFSLGGKLSEVERRRSQVHNVVERQAAVQARLGDRAPTREIDAELAGAENRVRIEQRHYDEAAAAYNRAAGGFPALLFRGIFGYPATVPLSADMQAGGQP